MASDAHYFASAHGGLWPPLPDVPGQLGYPLSPLRSDLLRCRTQIGPPGPRFLFAESDAYYAGFPTGDTYYWYLGHLIEDEAQGLAFVKAYRERARLGLPLADDFLSPSDGERPIPRISNPVVERLYPPPLPSASAAEREAWPPRHIPVLIERPRHLRQGEAGGNVLFLDGHVRWMPYPGDFPMTERFIRALESLDELESTYTREGG